MRRSITVTATLAIVVLAFATTSQAGLLSSSATAPVIDGADIAMLNTVGAFDPVNAGCCGGGDGGHIWSNRPVQGQTFTTLGNPDGYSLSAVTLQNEENSFNPNSATFTVNVGSVVGNVLTPLGSESASGVSYVPGDYITMTFTNPISLAPNTTYGFDWGTSGGGFTTFNNDDSNYTGGSAYSSGTGSTPDNSNLIFRGIDRVFHLDIESGMAPPPVAEPFAAGSFAINMGGRNPGYQLASTDAAGVVPVTDWLNLDNVSNVSGAFGPFALQGADNAQTAEVTWSATGTWGRPSIGGPDGDMMAGHIEATGGGETRATVSGLGDNFSSYDVYVYVGDDAGGRNGEIRFNDGAPQDFTSKIFDGTYTEGTDYFLFEGVAGDSFTVSVEPQNDDGANRTGIRGIQIQGVPEPSTMLLAVIGLLLSAGRIRRRR